MKFSYKPTIIKSQSHLDYICTSLDYVQTSYNVQCPLFTPTIPGMGRSDVCVIACIIIASCK